MQLSCYLQKKNQSYIQTEVYTTVGQDGEKCFYTINVKKGCSPDNSTCEGVFGRIKNEMFYNTDWSGVNISEFIGILNDYLHGIMKKRIKNH